MPSRKIKVIDGVWEHVVKQLSNSKELVLPGDIDSYIGNEGVFMIIQRFSALIDARPSVFNDSMTNTIRILPPPTMNGSSDKLVSSHENISPAPIKREAKIPRPPNAFILYRQHFHPSMKKQNPNLHNNEISVIIGNKWKEEEDSVKQKFRDKAKETKKAHELKYPNYQYQPRKASEKKRRMTKRKAALLKKQSKDSGSDCIISGSTTDTTKFDKDSAYGELSAYISTLKIEKEQSKDSIFQLPGINAFNVQLENNYSQKADFYEDPNDNLQSGRVDNNNVNNDFHIEPVSESLSQSPDEDLYNTNSENNMVFEMLNQSDENNAIEEDTGNFTSDARVARSVQELVHGPYDISTILHGDPYISEIFEDFAIVEPLQQVTGEITPSTTNNSHTIDDIYEAEMAANPQAFTPYYSEQITVGSSGQVSAMDEVQNLTPFHYVPPMGIPNITNSVTTQDTVGLDPELSMAHNQIGNNAANIEPALSTTMSSDEQADQHALNTPQAIPNTAPANNVVVGPDMMTDLESMLLEFQAEAYDQEQGAEVADFNNLFVNGELLPPVEDGYVGFEHI